MGRLALGGRQGERASQRPQRYVARIAQIPVGSSNPIPIPQTDYLTGIDLVPNLTLGTGGSAGTVPYGALQNVQVNAPGNQSPFQMPGYHADCLYRVHDQDYEPYMFSSTTQAGPIRVPLTVAPNTELAAWYTGDTRLNMSVAINWTATTALQGTVDVWREFFSAPQPDEQDGWLNQISYAKAARLFASGVQLANGPTTVTLDVDQDYMRILLFGYTGSYAAGTFAPAAGILQNVTLELNSKFRIWDTVTEAELKFENMRAYRHPLPDGVLCLDFARVRPVIRRDILPTDPTTTKRVALIVTSNSSNNYLDVVTESVTDSQFAAQWIASASQKQQTTTTTAS